MIGNLFATVGLRPPLAVLRFVLSALTLLAALLTFSGIVAALSTKNEILATKMLSVYPRNLLAMEAFRALQDMKYPIVSGPSTTTNIAVVSIDDPSWGVLIDFIRSEPAVRKSERTEALVPQPAAQVSPPPPQAQAPPNDSLQAPSTQAPSAPQTPTLPTAINFDRIKTISAIKNENIISAGPKALVPPYNLLVLWPANVGHRVYEFLSFEEFRLDLRHMMLDEIGEWGLWLSAFAFVCGLVINALRALVASAEQRELAKTTPSTHDAKTS
jgi:hypothetical protein